MLANHRRWWANAPMRSAFPCLVGFCCLAACTPETTPPAPTFTELQPRFFAALQVQDAATRQQLPSYEIQMEQAASALISLAESGTLTTEDAKDAAGRALFYSSFLLQAGQQAVQDNLMKPAELFDPHRYAPADTGDTNEYLARLAHGAVLLDRADRLRPRDNLSESVQANIDYQTEILRTGQPSQASLDAILAASNGGFAGTFNAMIMWRDPAQHPMTASYMEKLLDTVCSPFRFACDKMGMSPLPPGAAPTLTTGVSGPVLASDLLVRRAEAMLHRADDNPGARTASLDEAMLRLGVADKLLGAAQHNTQDPAWSHYPFTATLLPRRERLQSLLLATMSRLAGDMNPPVLPGSEYYNSTSYRLAYQCVGCHTRGAQTQGVPQ